MNEKKLFLLDAFALIYRAFFAFGSNPRVTSTGFNTSAIFGFTNTLLEVLEKERPTHIAVVFDTSVPTVRHIEFAEYKAHREEMPEDLRKAIPYIKRIIEGFNIPVVSYDGYEADDVIGTLAKQAEKDGYKVFMMTPDKDYGQLVSENIFIYKPASFGNKASILGIAEVCKKFEIERPEQVIDILGLMGDSVDNIPGIPGVGEVTAKKLIKQFGSVENMLNNTHEIKGTLRDKVENNKDKAILSKKLATIICDVPISVHEDDYLINEYNKEMLTEVFAELEFRRLSEKILGNKWQTETSSSPTPSPSKKNTNQQDLFAEPISEKQKPIFNNKEDDTVHVPTQNINTVAHEYILVDTDAKLSNLVIDLLAQKSICFDTETTGLDTFSAEIVGVSFSYEKHKGYYIPFTANKEEAIAKLTVLQPVFEHENIEKIGQNIKYDMAVLQTYGFELKGYLFDTMLAHYLLQPDMRHNMDVLAETYLNYTPVSITELIGAKGKKQGNMRDVAIEQVKEYAAEDADITWQLKQLFESQLTETATKKLFDELEMPLVPVLAAMETEGVRIDKEVLKVISGELDVEIQAIEKDIYALAGTTFNIASPKQLGDILFEVMRIDEKAKKTKTGQYATGEDVLAKLASKHPIVNKILEYREFQKLKNTYVDTLPDLINPITGRVHTSYNQAVAATGRLSSNNPNLQNIPIRTERGREIRKAFVPRNADYTLLSADYSQIELRIIAALANETAMINDFKNGIDIHTATAAKVYGVELSAVTSDMRRNAKMVNFGIIYGISAFGLAERLGIPRKESAEIIKQYFMQYPAIKEYMDSNIEMARKQGYVETIMGRRRYLKDINSGNATVRGYAERNAINAPIQGSAADMIKAAMINIHHEMKQRKMLSKMLLQVHDELVFDAYLSEVDELKSIVADKMRNAIKMIVPIEVEMGTGDNWLAAH